MATASAPVVGAQQAGADSRDAPQVPVVKPVGQAVECGRRWRRLRGYGDSRCSVTSVSVVHTLSRRRPQTDSFRSTTDCRRSSRLGDWRGDAEKRGVRCGIRLSRSRHLMPALRPSGTPRRSRPASRRQAGDWDSNPGSRLPRQRCSRIAGFNHPAIPSNTVRFPPPADHAVPNPRSGLAAHPNPRRRALLNHLQPAG